MSKVSAATDKLVQQILQAVAEFEADHARKQATRPSFAFLLCKETLTSLDLELRAAVVADLQAWVKGTKE